MKFAVGTSHHTLRGENKEAKSAVQTAPDYGKRFARGDCGTAFWVGRLHQADVMGPDIDTRGTYFFDAFESRRSTFIGP